MPALFTRMSRRPSPARVRSTIAARSARRVTSVGTASARRPRSFTSAAVLSAPPWSSSATTTSAPRRASSRAMARPIPRPAPVTIATCPCSSMACSCLDGAPRWPPARQTLGAPRLSRGAPCRSVGVARPTLLLGHAQPLLEQQLHLVGGGAPECVTRLLVGGLHLLAELRHHRVLLLLGRGVERL